MSFRDQTYLVILNWLCSVDFVSHFGTASCVSGSFNYRPLRGKEKKKKIETPQTYLISQCLFSSARLVPFIAWVSAAGLFSPALLSPPACLQSLAFIPLLTKNMGKMSAGVTRWAVGAGIEWIGEVGEGERLPCVVLVRCCVGSPYQSHPL